MSLKREVLLFLETKGWSELIDPRWTNLLINEIKEKFPNIKDEEINDILSIVIYKV